jgi:hypothetical protein
MAFTIYEGDMQEVVREADEDYSQRYIAWVSYSIKIIGEKTWLGVLNTGEIIPIEIKKKHRLQKVGICQFHYDLSSLIRDYRRGEKMERSKIKDVIKNRNRTLWEKEGRGV